MTDTKKRIQYIIHQEYEDYAVYRYRMEMDHLPKESEPLEPGIYTEGDPYMEMFEEDFVQTTLGLYLRVAHGNFISLRIQKGQWNSYG